MAVKLEQPTAEEKQRLASGQAVQRKDSYYIVQNKKEQVEHHFLHKGATFEKVSLSEAAERLKSICRENYHDMAAITSAQAQLGKSIAAVVQEQNRSVGVSQETGRPMFEKHAVVILDRSLTKEQSDKIKAFGQQLGGTVDNYAVKYTDKFGVEKQSWSSKIDFGKGTAWSADICAKIITGGDMKQILGEVERRVEVAEQKKAQQGVAQEQPKQQAAQTEKTQTKTKAATKQKRQGIEI